NTSAAAAIAARVGMGMAGITHRLRGVRERTNAVAIWDMELLLPSGNCHSDYEARRALRTCDRLEIGSVELRICESECRAHTPHASAPAGVQIGSAAARGDPPPAGGRRCAPRAAARCTARRRC